MNSLLLRHIAYPLTRRTQLVVPVLPF